MKTADELYAKTILARQKVREWGYQSAIATRNGDLALHYLLGAPDYRVIVDSSACGDAPFITPEHFERTQHAWISGKALSAAEFLALETPPAFMTQARVCLSEAARLLQDKNKSHKKYLPQSPQDSQPKPESRSSGITIKCRDDTTVSVPNLILSLPTFEECKQFVPPAPPYGEQVFLSFNRLGYDHRVRVVPQDNEDALLIFERQELSLMAHGLSWAQTHRVQLSSFRKPEYRMDADMMLSNTTGSPSCDAGADLHQPVFTEQPHREGLWDRALGLFSCCFHPSNPRGPCA